MEAMLPALLNLLAPDHLLMLLLGVGLGLVVGVLPGLGGIAGLSLVLPFTFGMEPSLALAMMIGILAPMHTSDTFPAVLMGIPGTASAQATVLDGFPLAKRGEAARALAAAFSSSLVGGLFGALVLTFAVFGAKPIILAMGFGELMMLTIFALSMVGMLTGSSALKGLGACGIGLLVGSIGGAPATGEFRLDFGTIYLGDGIPLVIMGLGLFALPEIVDLLRRHATISESGRLGAGWLDGLRDAIRYRWIVLRSSVAGCLIGALPGLGGSVADWITYGHVVQTSKDRSQFGHGDIRGVIAPEAASNAITGGSLIPTLLFGIPGSGSMAILLGGFILIGIRPGPSMVTTDLGLTFTIIWSLALANLIGAGACFLAATPVARLTTIPYALIGPVMLVIIFFGAFQATRGRTDLLALLAVGLLGIFLKRVGWPRPALLSGFVLSHGLEASVYRVTQVYGLTFLERPIVLAIGALTLASLVAAWRMRPSRRLAAGAAEAVVTTLQQRLPQIGFTAALTAFTLVSLQDSAQQSYLGRLFPLTMGLVTLAILGAIAFYQVRSDRPRSVLADADLGAATPHGNAHFVGWILALLGLAALVGFPLAAALFVLIFTTVKVGGPWWRNALLAACCIGALLLLAHLLTLVYPAGLLQSLFDMPWWLA
jgi:TctA family transporter